MRGEAEGDEGSQASQPTDRRTGKSGCSLFTVILARNETLKTRDSGQRFYCHSTWAETDSDFINGSCSGILQFSFLCHEHQGIKAGQCTFASVLTEEKYCCYIPHVHPCQSQEYWVLYFILCFWKKWLKITQWEGENTHMHRCKSVTSQQKNERFNSVAGFRVLEKLFVPTNH